MSGFEAPFCVQSEHVRGEPRMYWVEYRDPGVPPWSRRTVTIADFASNGAAVRMAERLNSVVGVVALVQLLRGQP